MRYTDEFTAVVGGPYFEDKRNYLSYIFMHENPPQDLVEKLYKRKAYDVNRFLDRLFTVNADTLPFPKRRFEQIRKHRDGAPTDISDIVNELDDNGIYNDVVDTLSAGELPDIF